jgi:hypothetical protein
MYLSELSEVRTIVALVLLNTVLAIGAAIRAEKFNLVDQVTFIRKDVVPLILAYGAFHIWGEASGFSAVATGVFLSITASLVGRIAGQISELGIKLPDILTGERAKLDRASSTRFVFDTNAQGLASSYDANITRGG